MQTKITESIDNLEKIKTPHRRAGPAHMEPWKKQVQGSVLMQKPETHSKRCNRVATRFLVCHAWKTSGKHGRRYADSISAYRRQVIAMKSVVYMVPIRSGTIKLTLKTCHIMRQNDLNHRHCTAMRWKTGEGVDQSLQHLVTAAASGDGCWDCRTMCTLVLVAGVFVFADRGWTSSNDRVGLRGNLTKVTTAAIHNTRFNLRRLTRLIKDLVLTFIDIIYRLLSYTPCYSQ